MANYSNNRRNNQRNSNQDWNNDYDQDRNQNRSQGFGNDRNDNDDRRDSNFNRGNNFNSSSDRNRFDSESGRRNEGQDFQSERWNRDENYDNLYGSDRGQDRQRGDSWQGSSNFGNEGNRFGGESNRGYSGFGSGNNNDSDRNRNRNQQDRGWWDRTRDEVSSWFGDDDAERRRQQDERQGAHKGRGPKGYTRSDDRIKEDVNDRLSDDPHIDASDINVNVTSGEVVLEGTVENRFSKRHAEDLAESVSGVKNVENRIRLKSASSSNANASSTSGTGATSSSASTVSSKGNFESSKS